MVRASLARHTTRRWPTTPWALALGWVVHKGYLKSQFHSTRHPDSLLHHFLGLIVVRSWPLELPLCAREAPITQMPTLAVPSDQSIQVVNVCIPSLSPSASLCPRVLTALSRWTACLFLFLFLFVLFFQQHGKHTCNLWYPVVITR